MARLSTVDGEPTSADFINVPSYQLAKSLPIELPSRAIEVTVDLAFSGAVYATLNADQVGLKVEPRNAEEFIKLGREIKASLGTRAHYNGHECFRVIIFQEEVDEEENGRMTVRQRNVMVFADGQIDRSPCGSGTCARLAVLHAHGRVGLGDRLLRRSIIESQFDATIQSVVESPIQEFPACIPCVTGRARLCGKMNFFINPSDPIFPGFLLR